MWIPNEAFAPRSLQPMDSLDNRVRGTPVIEEPAEATVGVPHETPAPRSMQLQDAISSHPADNPEDELARGPAVIPYHMHAARIITPTNSLPIRVRSRPSNEPYGNGK